MDDVETPIANAQVYVIVTSELGERRFTEATDADGRLLVEGLYPFGDSTVRFVLLDGSGNQLEVVVSPSGDDPQPVEVRQFGG